MKDIDRQIKIAVWIARIAVTLVFILNIQCAINFLFFPEQHIGAYGLSGSTGVAALQGIAVTFLMWNVTYPFVIVNPLKYRVVFIIVLIQQVIGLVGETFIYLTVGALPVLANSIMRFIIIDGMGLAIMLASFLWLQYQYAQKRSPKAP